MKKVFHIGILFLLSCTKHPQNDLIPGFTSNESFDNVWTPISHITEDKEFSIAYYRSGFLTTSVRVSKVFSLNNFGEWEKIQLKQGIVEKYFIGTDSVSKDIVIKDILTTKICNPQEGEVFLRQLIQLGIFEIGEEQELVEKCREEAGEVMEYDDGGTTHFIIVYGNKVRALHYNYPYLRIKDCPNQKEINNILKIQALFKNEWYVREH